MADQRPGAESQPKPQHAGVIAGIVSDIRHAPIYVWIGLAVALVALFIGLRQRGRSGGTGGAASTGAVPGTLPLAWGPGAPPTGTTGGTTPAWAPPAPDNSHGTAATQNATLSLFRLRWPQGTVFDGPPLPGGAGGTGGPPTGVVGDPLMNPFIAAVPVATPHPAAGLALPPFAHTRI